MTFVVVQRGMWDGLEADIELESSTATAFFTAARDYRNAMGRAMPQIAEPAGGRRTIAQTTQMRWAFDYGPHGMFAHSATAAERAQSDALYLKYNMSRVSTGRPVINGTHTTGFYFDVATAAFQTWLLSNGHRYGLTRPLGDADPNHWKYTPGTATVVLDAVTLGGGATPSQLAGGMDMPLVLGTVADQATVDAFNKRFPGAFAVGKATYVAVGLGSPGTLANALPTQDQALITEICKTIAPGLVNPSEIIIPAAAVWAVQMYQQSVSPLSVAGGVSSGAPDTSGPAILSAIADLKSSILTALAAVVAAVLRPSTTSKN